MDPLDAIRQFNVADVVIVLLVVGAFVFGFVTGVVHQLLTLLVWFIALLLAGNLMEPVGRWVSGYWTSYTAAYSLMLAFLVMFLFFAVLGEVLVFAFYRHTPMLARLAFADEIVGGLLASGVAILVIATVVLGLDSFYRYNPVASSAQQPILQFFQQGLDGSVLAGWLRGSLVPAIGLLGPLLPSELRGIV